jgi:hypothetical protein
VPLHERLGCDCADFFQPCHAAGDVLDHHLAGAMKRIGVGSRAHLRVRMPKAVGRGEQAAGLSAEQMTDSRKRAAEGA